jgi:hypothetical protein
MGCDACGGGADGVGALTVAPEDGLGARSNDDGCATVEGMEWLASGVAMLGADCS